jgi:hypothetical protein
MLNQFKSRILKENYPSVRTKRDAKRNIIAQETPMITNQYTKRLLNMRLGASLENSTFDWMRPRDGDSAVQ